MKMVDGMSHEDFSYLHTWWNIRILLFLCFVFFLLISHKKFPSEVEHSLNKYIVFWCWWIYLWKELFWSFQDPVGLLPQHRLVHAHPCYGHVQRDPHLRHDKWHALQVWRHSLLVTMETCTHHYTRACKHTHTDMRRWGTRRCWPTQGCSVFTHVSSHG